MNSGLVSLQGIVRGVLCRTHLRKSKDDMSLKLLTKLLEEQKRRFLFDCEMNKRLKKKKIRHANFPSHISENIVKFVLFRKHKIMPTWNTRKGDLEFLHMKVEVKAFSSKGPTTFGPTEEWDRIYFVDATQFHESKFKVYECKLNNTSVEWQQLLINSKRKQTYGDQCKQGRRPRLYFEKIREQLGTNCKMIFDGFLGKKK